MESLEHLQGPVVVTVVYFLFGYSLLFGLQSRTKYRLKALYAQEDEVFDRYFGQDEEMLAVDRVVANTHEQMGPFLASLWLYAIFGSPHFATWLGGAYILLRGIYPLLLGRRVSKTQSKRVTLVTFPSYAIVFFMLGSAAWNALAA
jgi:hypothetical protein